MNERSAIDWALATELPGPASRQAAVQSLAEAELAALHRRRQRMPPARLSDTEWAILLECFVADGVGRILATKSLETVSGVSATSMLRQLDALEGKGLISRAGFEGDRRMRLVRITPEGRTAVRAVYGKGASR